MASPVRLPMHSLSELKGWGVAGDDDIEPRRQYGPVDIDPGPYYCYVTPCMRISGFMTQDALDRHVRLFH